MSRIFLSPPWIGTAERRAMAAAFDSGYVAPCGPMVDEFDRRLSALSLCSAAAVSSGTAALDLLMDEFGVGPATTVIASSLTFVSTVGPAWHRGARLVFVDCDEDTGTISVPLLEAALADVRSGSRAVVIAADIYGQCCDYNAIEEVCREAGATLVIDAAESVGATSHLRPAGSAGDAAIYSFNGNKIITTSGGGAVVSRHHELVERARWRARQAREPVAWYEHRTVGYNYRLSNLLASVGCAQLERLPEIVRRKRATFAAYAEALKGKAKPYPCGEPEASTRWLSVFVYPSETARNKAAERLAEADIESRPVWKPMHLQPVFAGCRIYGGLVSEDLFRRGICLPSGAGLTSSQRGRVISILR